MSTTTELATEADPVADVADNLQLVARTPGEMKIAQQQLAAWCRQKIAILEKDAADLAENVEIAEKNNWKTASLARLSGIAKKRVQFYEKMLAAIEAGYCIVPNLPVQLFAIRTKRATPDRKASFRNWDDRSQQAQALPVGQGEFKNPVPEVWQRQNVPTGDTDSTGKEIKKTEYYAKEFQDEIEFPISVAKPVIMSATAEALALKCFDELGVLPEFRAKGDPLVVGVINGPSGKKVSFLIAWYVDTAAL